jgi:hypothetical protein
VEIQDYALELLLDLDGLLIEAGFGYWVKIEARMLEETSHDKPFGIKYSLTLHTSEGSRVLGYDNAHGFAKFNPFDPNDHVHKFDKILRYEFESVEKLLDDFWKDVFVIINRSVH